MFVDFLGAPGELPPPRYGCRRFLASPRGIKLSLRRSTCMSLKLNILPLHANLPWKSPCRLQSSNVRQLCSTRKKQSLPDVRLHVGLSIDPELLTAKGQLPHDEACRSLRTSTVFCRFHLQSQAASETHVVLFRSSWKRKPFLIIVFRIWSRRMFIWSQWCAWSSGFRRNVATAPSFLVAKPRAPVAKCDYAPGFFEPCLSQCVVLQTCTYMYFWTLC